MGPKKAGSRCGKKKMKMPMVVVHSSPKEGPSESAPVAEEPEVSTDPSPVASVSGTDPSPVASVSVSDVASVSVDDGEYKLYFFY